MDQFHKDLVRAEKTINNIQNDLVSREDLVQQQQSTLKVKLFYKSKFIFRSKVGCINTRTSQTASK